MGKYSQNFHHTAHLIPVITAESYHPSTSSLSDRQGCGFGVPRSPVVGWLWHIQLLDCTLRLVPCGFSQFTVLARQTTSSIHYIVHLLLEELLVSLKSSLSTQSVCHTISPRIGAWFWAQKRRPVFLVLESESECRVLNFPTTESESHKKISTGIPRACS